MGNKRIVIAREVTLGRGALSGGRRGRGPQRGEATLWPERHTLAPAKTPRAARFAYLEFDSNMERAEELKGAGLRCRPNRPGKDEYNHAS